jgi:hypothetical protein
MKEVLLSYINQIIKDIKNEYNNIFLKRYTLFWLFVKLNILLIKIIVTIPFYIMILIFTIIIILIIKMIYNKRIANFIIKKHLLLS